MIPLDNFWTAFVFFGGPSVLLFIWYLISFLISEKKKTVK